MLHSEYFWRKSEPSGLFQICAQSSLTVSGSFSARPPLVWCSQISKMAKDPVRSPITWAARSSSLAQLSIPHLVQKSIPLSKRFPSTVILISDWRQSRPWRAGMRRTIKVRSLMTPMHRLALIVNQIHESLSMTKGRSLGSPWSLQTQVWPKESKDTGGEVRIEDLRRSHKDTLVKVEGHS